MYPSKTAPERRADFIVHALSLGFVIPASVLLVQAAIADGNGWLLLAVIGYVCAGIASISISFVYHLSPLHDLRSTLRKWDHAAIYLVIAGVYGPLLVVCDTWSAYAILGVLWVLAIGGVAFKLGGGNPDSKWSLISYLVMGWFALIALPDFWAGLPGESTAAIAAGGLFYTIGSVFYARKSMPFRYPIWHLFGTCGGLSFFAAVWLAVTA